MNKKVRLGLAQINCTVGDLKGNSEKIISSIKKGRDAGVDIITFPEMVITGYPPEDLLLKPQFIIENVETLQRIANECHQITAIVGFADPENINSPYDHKAVDKRFVYNAAAVIHNKKIEMIYHKTILPNYGVFDERRYFLKGSKCQVFELDNVVFGVNICEDIWHSHGPTGLQALKGKADIILNINASPFHAGKHKEREEVLSQRIGESGVTISYTNIVGGQDELVFDGGSMIVDSDGKTLVRAPQFEESLMIADVTINKTNKQNNKIYVTDEGLVITHTLLKGKFKSNINSLRPIISPEIEPLDEIYNALVIGTRDYVRKSGFIKTIVGLSGGIDSALTVMIAVDALGAENVMGVALPSRYSSQGSIDDAKLIASNLKMEFDIISIEETFIALLNGLGSLFKGYESNVAEENLQARIRGTLLMALSNKFGRMVLTTGNKSEMSVGYSTLYGDMAGGFSVLKDVPKMLVYELSKYRNKKAGYNIIPEDSIKKAPSAELRPDQTDQDSLPPYEILDAILQGYIEEKLSHDEIISRGFEPDVVNRVIKMVDLNEYKRRQAAPGVKITPKAFGRDRRMPIINKFN